jgi:hypothetical protein
MVEVDPSWVYVPENKYNNNTYFKKFFTRYNNHLLDTYRHEQKTKIAKLWYENFLNPVKDTLEFRHGVMDTFREFLNSFEEINITRSAKQVEFHNLMVSTQACSVYGGKIFQKYHREICERYGWSSEDTFHMLSVYAARRFGKTQCVSMLGTGNLATCPAAELNIFAPSLEQSQMVLENIKKYFFMRCPQFKILKANDRKFSVQSLAGDVRKVHAWPKGVDVSFFFEKKGVILFYHFFSKKGTLIWKPN